MSIKIMTEVIEHAPVDQGTLLVLIMLADSADERTRECWPSVANVARRARLSDRQVQYCIKQLADVGILSIEPNAGRSGTNLYRITPHEKWGGCKNFGGEVDCTGGVKPTSPGGVKPTSPEPSIEPSIEPSTPRGQAALDLLGNAKPEKQPTEPDRFPDFWAAFPKKEGKAAAKKAWAKAIKRSSPDQIIAAAKVYASRIAGNDPKYTKWPQGWLNEERFLDDDLQPAPAKPFLSVEERRARMMQGQGWGEVTTGARR